LKLSDLAPPETAGRQHCGVPTGPWLIRLATRPAS
jgi:hypothetical protein